MSGHIVNLIYFSILDEHLTNLPSDDGWSKIHFPPPAVTGSYCIIKCHFFVVQCFAMQNASSPKIGLELVAFHIAIKSPVDLFSE